jgi:shikimate kinase
MRWGCKGTKFIHTFTAMRIYLVGYMASGKSNLGRQLAGKMGYEFVDTDYLFEERFRISVVDFFEKYDEGAFRKIEQSLLHETAGMDDTVISTGGGTPCFFDNMDFIKRSGISVYIWWDSRDLADRLLKVKRKRPLLKDIAPDLIGQTVDQHLEERAFYYEKADIIVPGNTIDIDNLADQIRLL